MLTVHALRIELGKSYRVAVDLLSEMPSVAQEIGLTRLPHYTVLRARGLSGFPLRRGVRFSARPSRNALTPPSIPPASIVTSPAATTPTAPTTAFEALKVTARSWMSKRCTSPTSTRPPRRNDAKIGPQVARRNAGDLRSLAADRGYDAKAFRDELRENGIRPLIKHRIMNPLDHAHNARIDGDRYHQRSMSETVFSSIKRTLGSAVRARSWWLEFREMLLKATVYNLRRSVRYP